MSISSPGATSRPLRPAKRRNRTKSKQNHIIETIRQKILTGEYPPESQLPVQAELAKTLNMSGVTVHKALESLAQQGFVQIRRGIGTFVPKHPPHLCNYAIVFPIHPGDVFWSHFYEAIQNEALLRQETEARIFHFFYITHANPTSPDYQNLERMVLNRQLAGIIFASTERAVLQTPVLDAPGTPRVLISEQPSSRGLPTVAYDNRMMIQKSLQYFQEIGVKRLAAFFIGKPQNDWIEWMPLMAEQGLYTRPYWCFGIAPEDSGNASPIARMLMDYPPNERPDGILVTDEHLVSAVESGLLQSQQPEAFNIRIIAQCNFPHHYHPQLPIKRIGYDARRILQASLEKIDSQSLGGHFPLVTTIPPRFDHEL